MWIEFLKEYDAHKIGATVDLADEAEAKALVKTGTAKEAKAPADVVEATTAIKGELEAFTRNVVKEVTKELLAGSGGGNARPRIGLVDEGYELGSSAKFTLPASAKRFGTLRNFTGPDAEEKAYRFGMWCLANYASNLIIDPERKAHMRQYIGKAQKLGVSLKMARAVEDEDGEITATKALGGGVVSLKASNESNNTASGFLVPDEFQDTLVDLREKFGVFRQNAKIIPMASDTRSDPRRRGGVTAYYVGEDGPGTQSTKTWDRVRLTAKKLMFLSKYSNELSEDAVLNIADDLAGEAAYAFANTEDQAGFNGDGTGTYGSITGVRTAIKNVDATIANILGLVVATGTGYGTSYNSITLGDFNKVVATLPEYADDGAKWYVSKFVWGSVMQRLAMAAGGNNVANINAGALVKMFAGYPVVVSQVMPKTPAVNQVCALFGRLDLGARLGDRRQFSLSLSDSALNSFEQDEMAMRATERFAITVHDVGESSAGTARDPVNGLMAGPIVGLITASS